MFNVLNVNKGPPSLSPLSGKARIPFHYNMIGNLFFFRSFHFSPSSTFSSIQVSFHFILHSIVHLSKYSVQAVKPSRAACVWSELIILSTPPPLPHMCMYVGNDVVLEAEHKRFNKGVICCAIWRLLNCDTREMCCWIVFITWYKMKCMQNMPSQAYNYS